MRRRPILLLAFGVPTFVAVYVACTFPDVGFGDPSVDAGAGDTRAPADDANVAPDANGDGDGGADLDAYRFPESAPPIDATSEKPDTGACADPCDCDKDGFRAKDASCSPGNVDCDDGDPRATPTAGFSDAAATIDTKGDWNCDGTTERRFPVNIRCSDFSSLDGKCATREGFTGDPPCGVLAEYVACKAPALGLTCAENPRTTRVQECR